MDDKQIMEDYLIGLSEEDGYMQNIPLQLRKGLEKALIETALEFKNYGDIFYWDSGIVNDHVYENLPEFLKECYSPYSEIRIRHGYKFQTAHSYVMALISKVTNYGEVK